MRSVTWLFLAFGWTTFLPGQEDPDRVVLALPADLSDPAQWPSGDVLWATAQALEIPAEVELRPLDIPDRLEYANLTFAGNAAAVAAAEEGMRLLAGPMSPEQEQAFAAKWAPARAFPTPEVVDYLNRLNPLLVRFLEARAAFSTAAAVVQEDLGGLAVARDAEDPAMCATLAAALRGDYASMTAARDAMAVILREVAALGPMPNPFEARARRRQQFEDDLAEIREELDLAGEPYWVLRGLHREESPASGAALGGQAFLESVEGYAQGGLFLGSLSAVPAPAAQPAPPAAPSANHSGRAEMVGFVSSNDSGRDAPDAFLVDVAHLFRWSVPPAVIPAEPASPLVLPLTVECSSPRWTQVNVSPMLAVGPGSLVLSGTGTTLLDPSATTLARPAPVDGSVLTETLEIPCLTSDHPGADPSVPPGEESDGEPAPDSPEEPAGDSPNVDPAADPAVSTGEDFAAAGPSGDAEAEEEADAADSEGGYGGIDLSAVLDAVMPQIDEIVASATSDAVAFPGVTIRAETPGGTVSYTYSYEWRRLELWEVHEIEAEAERRLAQAGSVGRALEEDRREVFARIDEAARAERARQESLALQREFAEVFRGELAQVEQALAATADPAARRQLALSLLYYDAQAKAAEDQVHFLETGEYVHTRTRYDAYNLERMTALTQQRAREIQAPMAITKSVLRQIELAPPHRRDALRDRWYRETLEAGRSGPGDLPHQRAVAGAIAEEVRAYHTGVSERQQDHAYYANLLTRSAEAVEFGAGVALMGVGSAAATAARFPAVMAWALDAGLGAAYGGATGYCEGGPQQAMRQSLEWAGTVGLAVTGLADGWAAHDNVWEGLRQAATNVLIAKAVELGARRLLTGSWSNASLPDADDFERGMREGRELVREAARAEWELARAITQGAPLEVVEQMTESAKMAAARANASWYAKFQLKLGGPSITGAAFDQRLSGVYDDTMPEFLEQLRALGYDVDQLRFRPMRNPSSAGTVSMDLDLALLEGQGLVLTRNGQRVSVGMFQEEAQQAWNRAYAARTGLSAERSLLNITTSAHQESFSLRLLQQEIPFDSLTVREIEQAAQVLRAKVANIPLAGTAKMVENCRGLAKEMQTKFLPYLRSRLQRAGAAGDPARAAGLARSEAFWREIHDLFAEVGKHPHSAGELAHLEARLRQLTGGRSVPEIADQLATVWEGLAKFTP